jgi:single-stranded DNA-binding protein
MEVTGALTSRKYQDQNGNTRVAFEVECDEVSFCLTNGKVDKKEPQFEQPQIPDIEELSQDDDLPF